MKDNHNNHLNNDRAIEQLTEAVDGLWWLSESDYPWKVIYWQDRNKCDRQFLLQHYNYPEDTKVVTKTLDSFLQPATIEREWHDRAERIEIKRYRELYDLLEHTLNEIQVYLVGEIEIDVYILGKLDSQTVVGLSTKIVVT